MDYEPLLRRLHETAQIASAAEILNPLPNLTTGITEVILSDMKTAISIPDRVFRAAEQLAKRLGMSRSELYVKAIQHYLSEHDRRPLIERMNAVCDKVDTSLDPALRRAQIATVAREDW